MTTEPVGFELFAPIPKGEELVSRLVDVIEVSIEELERRITHLERLLVVSNPPGFKVLPDGENEWAKEHRAKWGPYFAGKTD
jgi:hypothetical protein